MKNLAIEQAEGGSSDVIYTSVLGEAAAVEGPVLDVGCGKGAFLNLMSQRHSGPFTGCDGGDYGSGDDGFYRFVKADLNERLPFENNSFSLITAIEVIEHLENPRHFLREIHRTLKPGGKVIVTTPNNESITSLLSLMIRGYFSAFADNCYPAHITPVLRIDLKRMLNELSFQEIAFRYTNQGRVPGLNLYWQSVCAPLFKGCRFSDNLVVSAVKAAT